MSHQNHCHDDGECHQGHCCHHHHGEENSCHQEGHSECGFAEQLLEMADEAWMEVLKEKIKGHILATKGAHLDKLAKLVAESNEEKWKNKMVKHHGCENYKQKLKEFFQQNG